MLYGWVLCLVVGYSLDGTWFGYYQYDKAEGLAVDAEALPDKDCVDVCTLRKDQPPRSWFQTHKGLRSVKSSATHLDHH